MSRMLVDAVALCDHPHDEDAMVGILQQLLKVPRVSTKIEKADYGHEIFEKNDILSLPTLLAVDAAMLEGLGVSVGHAVAMVTVLFKLREAVPVDMAPQAQVINQPRARG